MRKRNPGFIRTSAVKDLQRLYYRRTVLDLVKAEIPNIEAPTPADFWPTVEYYAMNFIPAPEAAAKLVALYKGQPHRREGKDHA